MSFKLSSIFLCLLWLENIAAEKKYCEVFVGNLPCVFGCRRSSICGETTWGYEPLTQEEREFILNTVNNYRNEVALGKNSMGFKSATNIHVLSYDKESEYLVACFLKQCRTWKPYIFLTLDGTALEMTGYAIVSMNETRNRINLTEISAAFGGWYILTGHQVYGDMDDFVNVVMIQKLSGSIGDFVQMVWAETKFIGCAKFYHRYNFGVYRYNFACAYRPGAGWERPTIYDVGPSASRCQEFYGSNPNSEYTGLCGEIRSFEADPFKFEDYES